MANTNGHSEHFDSTMPRALLSMVLPAYNEEEVLPETYARFSAACPKFAELGLDYEIIFVNDGSKDSTPALLDALAANDPHVPHGSSDP